MARKCTVLRVFTRDGEGGNPLGVITDLAGLTTMEMQHIAAELGYSETIFVDITDRTPRVRIFTPASELPFAGHPLVGAGWLLRGRGVGSLRCQAGPVGVEGDGSGMIWIEPPFTQPVAPGTGPGWGEKEAVVVSMPLPYVLARFASPSDLADLDAPAGIDQAVYVWAWRDETTVTARFFAAAHGVVEDPATGSAAVALAAALRHGGMSSGRLRILQGDHVDAPSEIALVWDESRVRVGGHVAEVGIREVAA